MAGLFRVIFTALVTKVLKKMMNQKGVEIHIQRSLDS
jgi:hypothetical protein